MLTVFTNSMRRYLWQILGWGLSLAVLGGYLIRFYDMMAAQQAQLSQLFKNYPPELMAFFGDMDKIFTPSGYLDTEFFSYMTLIIGIYAVLSGSGLLAGDEENGTLDLVMAHPISRTALFMGRLAAFVIATLGILVITWLGFVISMPGTSLKISPGDMALPFLSLFSILILFGALALVVSLLLPSRRLSAMVAGLVLVASFFISSLVRIDNRLEEIAKFSPLNYYQGGLAVDGMDWKWFGGLLAVSVVLILLTWWRFESRDIRVSGEGSWRIPGLAFGRKDSA